MRGEGERRWVGLARNCEVYERATCRAVKRRVGSPLLIVRVGRDSQDTDYRRTAPQSSGPHRACQQ
eukprot:4002787-Prymnesium_polylepis.1